MVNIHSRERFDYVFNDGRGPWNHHPSHDALGPRVWECQQVRLEWLGEIAWPEKGTVLNNQPLAESERCHLIHQRNFVSSSEKLVEEFRTLDRIPVLELGRVKPSLFQHLSSPLIAQIIMHCPNCAAMFWTRGFDGEVSCNWERIGPV